MTVAPVWQYAERQPIGLESVIKGAPDAVVRDFYHRWYRFATPPCLRWDA